MFERKLSKTDLRARDIIIVDILIKVMFMVYFGKYHSKTGNTAQKALLNVI